MSLTHSRAVRRGMSPRPRRGTIVVLTAIIIVVLLIMVAFAVDGGVVALVRTELQRASDSAALAGATKIGYDRSEVVAEADLFASQNNKVGGDRAELKASEVEIGVWDRDARTFTPGEKGNAVRVTTRATDQGTFFARVMGTQDFDGQATAIATAIPRDIVFVVDQSGSMNDDSEPAWAPQTIGNAANTIAATLGYDLFGQDISESDAVDLNAFVNAAGYETAAPEYAYAVLTMNGGPLANLTDPSYKIKDNDSESTRKARAYRWFREQFLPTAIPSASPPFTETAYWNIYLDYIIRPLKHSFPPPDNPPKKPKEPKPPVLDYQPCCTNCPGPPSPPVTPPPTTPPVTPPPVTPPPVTPPPVTPPPPTPGPVGMLPGDCPIQLAASHRDPIAGTRSVLVRPRTNPFRLASTHGMSLIVSTLAVAQTPPPEYDPACQAAVLEAYEDAYAQYLIDHNHWATVLMPAWHAAMDHYNNVYLPAYMAEAKKHGAPPFKRNTIPKNPHKNEFGKVDRVADIGFNSYKSNNPNQDLAPGASDSLPAKYFNHIGRWTYAQFVQDYGRNLLCDGVNLSPLSLDSPYCQIHSESVGDPDVGYQNFSFPPRTQPMHAARRSLIRAVMAARKRNDGIKVNLRDRIAIVGFDRYDSAAGVGPTLIQPLTGVYETAMQSCAELQAVGDKYASTSLEPGMIMARQHLQAEGRDFADKLVIVITDGVPNGIQSATSVIDTGVSAAASPANFYSSDQRWPGDRYWLNGPLVQASQMQADEWDVYAIGMGYGVDSIFLERMARLGGTFGKGESLQASGSPDQQEEALSAIMKKIINTPRVMLVQ